MTRSARSFRIWGVALAAALALAFPQTIGAQSGTGGKSGIKILDLDPPGNSGGAGGSAGSGGGAGTTGGGVCRRWRNGTWPSPFSLGLRRQYRET